MFHKSATTRASISAIAGNTAGAALRKAERLAAQGGAKPSSHAMPQTVTAPVIPEHKE